MSDDAVRLCAVGMCAVRVLGAALRRAGLAALLLLCAGGFGFAARADAQEIRLPIVSAGPSTLSGLVVDETGKPLSEIDVFIEQLQRRTRSAANGRFQFDGVKEGKYTVSARSIGYDAIGKKITVKDTGAVVRFEMKRTAFSLPSRITTASRGGLSGIIADTGFRAMPGVRVRVSGESVDVLTDASGQFFAPLKPGKYLVRLEREGFARQLIGVTVPPDSGRQLAAWMIPQKGRDNPQEGANLFDLNMNMLRGRAATYFVFTQQDIANSPHKDLRAYLAAAEGRNTDPTCTVLINGGPRREPIWKLNASEIEFMELSVYTPPRSGAGPPPKSVDFLKDKKLDLKNAGSSGQRCSGVSVWLRR